MNNNVSNNGLDRQYGDLNQAGPRGKKINLANEVQTSFLPCFQGLCFIGSLEILNFDYLAKQVT